jgi:hypothetical protein
MRDDDSGEEVGWEDMPLPRINSWDSQDLNIQISNHEQFHSRKEDYAQCSGSSAPDRTRGLVWTNQLKIFLNCSSFVMPSVIGLTLITLT